MFSIMRAGLETILRVKPWQVKKQRMSASTMCVHVKWRRAKNTAASIVRMQVRPVLSSSLATVSTRAAPGNFIREALHPVLRNGLSQ
jgi:hypothetical protein